MSDKLATATALILIASLVIGIGWGVWQLKRKASYYFGYQAEVRKELAPLEKRISALEAEVINLKAKQ